MIIPAIMAICLCTTSAALIISAVCVKRERDQIKRRFRFGQGGFWNKGRSLNRFSLN